VKLISRLRGRRAGFVLLTIPAVVTHELL
jgi:hypothetical protein